MNKQTLGKRIIILGCTGSGKSTLAGSLSERTGLPLYHLDNLWWNKDRTHIPRPAFDRYLAEILDSERWIIDGDYSRTYEVRFKACDTVIFLDCDEETCMHGLGERAGKHRSDMPWIDEEVDPELIEMVHTYRSENRPKILALAEKYSEKQFIVFCTRKEAESFLSALE